jgi:hypothetical protein
MRDLPQRERAQLGLQYIEDAIVTLLTEHSPGLSSGAVADALGLRADIDPSHGEILAEGILALLAANGRVLWDAKRQIYVDNPARN